MDSNQELQFVYINGKMYYGNIPKLSGEVEYEDYKEWQAAFNAYVSSLRATDVLLGIRRRPLDEGQENHPIPAPSFLPFPDFPGENASREAHSAYSTEYARILQYNRCLRSAFESSNPAPQPDINSWDAIDALLRNAIWKTAPDAFKNILEVTNSSAHRMYTAMKNIYDIDPAVHARNVLGDFKMLSATKFESVVDFCAVYEWQLDRVRRLKGCAVSEDMALHFFLAEVGKILPGYIREIDADIAQGHALKERRWYVDDLMDLENSGNIDAFRGSQRLFPAAPMPMPLVSNSKPIPIVRLPTTTGVARGGASAGPSVAKPIVTVPTGRGPIPTGQGPLSKSWRRDDQERQAQKLHDCTHCGSRHRGQCWFDRPDLAPKMWLDRHPELRARAAEFGGKI